MGSGARAERQMIAQLNVEAGDYLATLKSGGLDFTGQFDAQTRQLKDLGAALARQPVQLSRPVNMPPVQGRTNWKLYAALAAAVFAGLWFMERK